MIRTGAPHFFVNTSAGLAGISLPRLLQALPAWVAGAELLASAAEQPRAQTAVALRPDAEVAAVLPASVAVVAGQPHALAVVAWRPDAEAVEVMALRISTRRPQACPGTQVATGALTGKPLALNRQVRWWPLLVSMEMLTALELTHRGRAWRLRELSMRMGLVPAWPHWAPAWPVSLSPAASWWAFPLLSGSSARHLGLSQVSPICPAAAERPWCRERAAHWPWAVPDAVSH